MKPRVLMAELNTDLVQTDYEDVKRTEMVAPNVAMRFKTTQNFKSTIITAKYLKKTFKMSLQK